jgi:hypothetical protein
LFDTIRVEISGYLAQARAAVVVGGGGREAGIDLAHPHDVDQEAHELVAAPGELGGLLPQRRLVVEQLREMQAHHAGAGAGRGDDVIVAPESFDQVPGQRLGRGAVARVERRLPAAGLLRRHLDRAARRLQQPHRGKADGRPEQVDEAGDEEGDARLFGHGEVLGPQQRRKVPQC